MNTQGNMLLNSIPFSVGNYFRTSKDNVSRISNNLVGNFLNCETVKNKEECMNMMARRTESKLKKDFFMLV